MFIFQINYKYLFILISWVGKCLVKLN